MIQEMRERNISPRANLNEELMSWSTLMSWSQKVHKSQLCLDLVKCVFVAYSKQSCNIERCNKSPIHIQHSCYLL
jgi:hypothetical protein